MHNLFKDPSCYKNPKKSSCIDLILTNFLNPFMETQGTCLSDFHKMTFAVLKMHFEKPKSKIVICRDNRNFCWIFLIFLCGIHLVCTKHFQKKRKISHPLICTCAHQEVRNVNYLEHFAYVLNGPSSILENHAPLKKWYVRANEKDFIDEEVKQEIMVWSKLLNKFLRAKTEESRIAYFRQRNSCVNILRRKKERILW